MPGVAEPASDVGVDVPLLATASSGASGAKAGAGTGVGVADLAGLLSLEGDLAVAEDAAAAAEAVATMSGVFSLRMGVEVAGRSPAFVGVSVEALSGADSGFEGVCKMLL